MTARPATLYHKKEHFILQTNMHHPMYRGHVVEMATSQISLLSSLGAHEFLSGNPNAALSTLEGGRGVSLVVVIDIQQLEAICH